MIIDIFSFNKIDRKIIIDEELKISNEQFNNKDVLFPIEVNVKGAISKDNIDYNLDLELT